MGIAPGNPTHEIRYSLALRVSGLKGNLVHVVIIIIDLRSEIESEMAVVFDAIFHHNGHFIAERKSNSIRDRRCLRELIHVLD